MARNLKTQNTLNRLKKKSPYASLTDVVSDLKVLGAELDTAVKVTSSAQGVDFDASGAALNGHPMRRATSACQYWGTKQTMGINGTAGTYHKSFQVPTDVVGVGVITNVVTAPGDATYTSDEIYNAIAVAPSATLFNGSGDPIASGGASSWVSKNEVVFARQAGATQQNPIPVVSQIFDVGSVARTDGGPGRIMMVRAYHAGGARADAAQTQGPVWHDSIDGAAANIPDWQTYYPLTARGENYFKAGDYASANQDAYTGLTRVAYNTIIGLKAYYSRPVVQTLYPGDSITLDSTADTAGPEIAPWWWIGINQLQADGVAIDGGTVSYPGYRWDQLGPWLTRVVPILKPDIVVLPAWTPNGTGAAGSNANTAAAADMQWLQCMQYVEWLYTQGVRDVVLVGPWPTDSAPIAVQRQRARVRASSLPYFDPCDIVGDTACAWIDGMAIETTGKTHPTQLANNLVGAAWAAYLKRRYSF